MAEVIRMPRLSDTMTEGKIVSWNKKVGDKIKIVTDRYKNRVHMHECKISHNLKK